MESRQVSLLTQAYKTGRLDFEYPTPLSRLREQFILNEIERENLLEGYKLKSLVAAATIAVSPKEGIKSTNDLVKSYLELGLPYLFKQDKIVTDNKHLGPVTKDKLKEWDTMLKQYNAKKN